MSPFITTQMREPTHLSMSSAKSRQYDRDVTLWARTNQAAKVETPSCLKEYFANDALLIDVVLDLVFVVRERRPAASCRKQSEFWVDPQRSIRINLPDQLKVTASSDMAADTESSLSTSPKEVVLLTFELIKARGQ